MAIILYVSFCQNKGPEETPWYSINKMPFSFCAAVDCYIKNGSICITHILHKKPKEKHITHAVATNPSCVLSQSIFIVLLWFSFVSMFHQVVLSCMHTVKHLPPLLEPLREPWKNSCQWEKDGAWRGQVSMGGSRWWKYQHQRLAEVLWLGVGDGVCVTHKELILVKLRGDSPNI